MIFFKKKNFSSSSLCCSETHPPALLLAASSDRRVMRFVAADGKGAQLLQRGRWEEKKMNSHQEDEASN